MGYFNIKKTIFIVPSKKYNKEFEKIDKFMEFLENSGMEKIIENVKYKNNECKGKNGYNPYILFAMIIYCFAKFKATLIIEYELLKEQVRNNLLSPKGIGIRINRSIQVEKTFGQIKNNMNYDRIRRRGLEKVSTEIMLMCLGVNIRRYFASLVNIKFKSNCWNTPTNLQKERFPYVKPKKKKLSRN